MKTAIKLTTGILATAIMAGGAWAGAMAQNTDAIDNARSIAKSLQQKQANDTNAALDAAGIPASSKPAPGAPAPAVKPAVIPGSTAPAAKAAAPAVKPAAQPAAKAAASAQNQLQRVNVVQAADGVRVEIVSSQPVTPRLSKLSSPARVLVELPETVPATSQNHIPYGSNGVKGVRIGMDGKTPPTTSIVVDLDTAIPYELTPSSDGKVILTLHAQSGAPVVAKSAPAPAKAAPAPAQSKTTAAKAAPVSAPKVAAAKDSKPAPADTKQQAKTAAPVKTTTVAANTPAPAPSKTADVGKPAKADEKKDEKSAKAEEKKEEKKEDKKWAMNGKRDPFFSPVVQQQGSGCSTGKKCLEIGNINLRGVVKSDSGFIAVVTNNLNKAYFLRENDPVFNGYVVKITGDSVVFQETIQDKLGKPFTREVVKRIFTPAV